MSEILKTSEYFVAVSNLTRCVLDRNSGKQYGLRSLFFKQRFSQGNYAFMNYSDLQEKATGNIADSCSELSELGRNIQALITAKLSSTAVPIDLSEDVISRLKNANGSNSGSSNSKTGSDEYDSDNNADLKNVSDIVKERIYCGTDREIHKTNSDYPEKEIDFQPDILKKDRPEECRKLIYSETAKSRVLMLASAGYGKSTLIQRIALAYGPCITDTAADRKSDWEFKASIEEKEIKDEIVPCIIELRDCIDTVDNLDACILRAIRKTIGDRENIEIKSWLASVKNQLLLLIDGLDELPKELACEFLKSLNSYLLKNPDIRVILTSRIAGVDDVTVQGLLKKMKFRGRTIMPLDEQETTAFCQQWIDVTNDSNDLLRNLERIRTESHLSYLREFMRKPLELVMLLHYIPKHNFSTFNRWELFYNILWAEITNHIDFDSKQLVFDDECKLLGYVAYKMQLSDRMSITYTELSEMVKDIQRLSFYSDLFLNEGNSELISVERIWLHFKSLAQNIGIIETIDDARSITMPIRSYQEFLAAYACCNLNLVDGDYSPNPQKILLPHINNASWIGVLGFSIAGMEYSSYSELDEFLKELYTGTDSISGLCSLLDTDCFNSRTVARVLCELHFHHLSLSEEKKSLVLKCMNTRSAASFRLALSALYKKSHESGKADYLEAAAFAYLSNCLNKRDDLVQCAAGLLGSSLIYEKSIGAELLIIAARIALGEEPIKRTEIITGELNDTIINALYLLALQTKATVFVQALTELYSSQLGGFENIHCCLDDQLLSIACKNLVDESNAELSVLATHQTIAANYGQYLKHMINMVGTFPVTKNSKKLNWSKSIWVDALIGAYYEVARNDVDYDQTGIAVCKYHMSGDWEEFMNHWVEDVCKGRPSSQVRKDHLSLRENHHFQMVRGTIDTEEEEYLLKRESLLNSIDMALAHNPAQLFSEGRDAEAMDCAVKQYRVGAISDNNMAFLVRYLNYDPQEEFGMSRFEFIQELLSSGVASSEPYSVMNYALTLLEEQRSDEATHLIDDMRNEDIQMIADSFWYPEMWIKRKTAEGALVCLVAHKRVIKEYSEHTEMKEYILAHQPQWSYLL